MPLVFHFRDIFFVFHVRVSLIFTHDAQGTHFKVFKDFSRKVLRQPFRFDPLKHRLVLHIVINQFLVKFFFDLYSSTVATRERFHAQSTSDNGQNLCLLIAHIYNDSRVHAGHIKRRCIAKHKIDTLATKLLEARVADGFDQWA